MTFYYLIIVSALESCDLLKIINNQHIIPLHLLKYSEVKILKLTNCVLRFLLNVLYGPSVAPGGPL